MLLMQLCFVGRDNAGAAQKEPFHPGRLGLIHRAPGGHQTLLFNLNDADPISLIAPEYVVGRVAFSNIGADMTATFPLKNQRIPKHGLVYRHPKGLVFQGSQQVKSL